MGIDQGEGIELAGIAGVIQRAEVAPIDFKPLSGQRFHSDEGAFGRNLRSRISHVLTDNAVASLISHGAELLLDDGGTHKGVFLKPFGNSALERIEFARAVTARRVLRRRIEIFPDRLPAHVELPHDFPNGPVFGPVQPVQLIDLIGGQHCFLHLCGRIGERTSRMLFARWHRRGRVRRKCFNYPDLCES